MKLNDYNGVILKLHKEGLKFTSIADKLIKMYELDESEHRNLGGTPLRL